MAEQLRKERRSHVQALRRLAQQAGATGVDRDDASRKVVIEMMSSIRDCSNETINARAAAISDRYLATFGLAPAAAALHTQAVAEAPAVRLRGRSFLLTYNWDLLRKGCGCSLASACLGHHYPLLSLSRRRRRERERERLHPPPRRWRRRRRRWRRRRVCQETLP